MTLPVLATPEAEAQIREIDTWWRINRSAAPDLFLLELSEAFDLLGAAPRIGRAYRKSPIPQVRRVLLKGTRYHVYYAVTASAVVVLALWHAQRGVGPPLRAS